MRRFSTKAIHGHEYYDENLGVFIPPIYLTAMFEQPNRKTGSTLLTDRNTELKYSREENPTVRALEHILAKLENGEDALAFNSGMGAILTVYLAFLEKSDEVVVPMEGYGTSIQLLTDIGAKFGVQVKKVWPDETSIIEAISSKTKFVILETMTNPTLKVINVREVTKEAFELNVLTVVDNTFATPLAYNPLDDNATIVIHSTTKYIAGHNDVIGGALITNSDMTNLLWDWRRKLGSMQSPFDAYLTLRGVKTLSIRFEKQCRNAQEIAEFLNEHPKVEEVLYPGLPTSPHHSVACKLFKKKLFGSVLSFKVKGGQTKALQTLRKTKIIKSSPSLGGTETLLTYPVISAAKTIPEEDRIKLGITDNLLRLSVGLEDINDLIEDLDKALKS